jgi:hypothetical protein
MYDKNKKVIKYKINSLSYNIELEFKTNSSDLDILNITLFPPENIIEGRLATPDSNIGYRLGESRFKWAPGNSSVRQLPMILPYNQTILLTGNFYRRCPFR